MVQPNGDICLPQGLYILHEQCLIRFQFYIRQPDGLTVCGTEGTEGIPTNAEVVFLGKSPTLKVSEQLAGRFFNAFGEMCIRDSRGRMKFAWL